MSKMSCPARLIKKNIIVFTDLSYLNSSIKKEYFYEIQECGGFSILKLSSVSPLFSERGDIPFKLTPNRTHRFPW